MFTFREDKQKKSWITYFCLVLVLEFRMKVDITLLNLLKNFTFAKILAFEPQPQ